MDAELDNELRQDFLVEAGELLQRLDEQLVGLEAAPGDGELLNAVFRAFHTVKGGAGFLALEPMVLLCHHAEDLLNEARNGKLVLGAVQMDALLQALDLLNGMMVAVGAAAPLQTPPPALLAALLPQARPVAAAAPAPPVVAASSSIDDSEFEALLDSMYGNAAPGTVAPAPLPAAPAASATTIDDDEFEALLDALHGKPGQPAAPLPTPVAAAAPAVAAAPAAAPAHHAAPAENSVRVDTARLDLLVNHAGELVLLRNRLLSLAARHGSEALAAAANELDRITDELQGAVMGMRMQPVGRLFQRFPRIVRDLARQLGKDVELVLEGEGTDLDRSLVEALADPLIHLLRNALDHGVEMPDARERAGKPRKGRVCLSASQRGERIVIAVRDDGRGMDPEILRRKAVEKGVIDAVQASRLSDGECYELIFRPGFSTAAAVSDISGRGVGMDVVKTRVAELGGTLQVRSTLGQGSELELTVPLTLAVLRVLMVRVDTRLFALPMGNVAEVFELDAGQDCLLDGRLIARHRGRALPLLDLTGWAGAPAAAGRHVVVLHIGHRRLGCLVHEVLGREDVIVKPLGPLFDGVPGIAGATVTGDGRLALVMDLAGLAGDDDQPSTSLQSTG
ncbi:chemotaxis protein CheA [Rhodanobacter thiooxydans]|uniref:Chemotaxis protein CheA n=1 Tax=Rhodanobacter thiooxydans TaxID=416169 RepID=A0A154QI36_9GAMM|nr:chemotaxis protein CheA [Rhodanobacter thiooxydans]KZC23799.1 chemotaxis protein CheA [Rhodanobacter thiooxydans]MCW0201465.1 chemotaxis protein CheA [Rhodanobacter thiooxydans]